MFMIRDERDKKFALLKAKYLKSYKDRSVRNHSKGEEN